MNTIVFHATLFNNNVGTSGLAMRTVDHRVFFQTEAAGLWTELGDDDAPRLHLHGRKDLSDSQALRDGNLVVRVSQTLQGGA